MKTFNKEQLNKDINTFNNKRWLSEDNKNLLRLIADLRLNLAPCTVFTLDKHGFNPLDIISISSMVDKKIHTLTASDCDLLNLWESEKGIIFGYEKKVQGKYQNAKMDHFCYSFRNKMPLGVAGLFSLSLYKSK